MILRRRNCRQKCQMFLVQLYPGRPRNTRNVDGICLYFSAHNFYDLDWQNVTF